MPLQKPNNMTAADYFALGEGRRAELIDGELWDQAAPSRVHQEIVIKLASRLNLFIEQYGGPCKAYTAPFAVNLFGDDTTFVEPDVSAICDRSKLSERGCEGAPDFVVEVVSPSNPDMDYVSKLNLYRSAGVREYWVCDPRSERVFAYRFGSAELISVHDFSEPVESEVFEGFSVDFAHIVAEM